MEPELNAQGLMTVPEFATKMLRCSESMGWRLARENAFPVIRNGRLVRVEPRRALEAYLKKFGVDSAGGHVGAPQFKRGRPAASAGAK
jgi:hypothetical protein